MSDTATNQSVLANLFRQNRWANLETIDTCAGMDPALLDAAAPGTVGTIRDTLWHVVEAESHFLAALNGHPSAAGLAPLAGSGGDLATLREHAARIGDGLVAWAESIEGDPMLAGEWCDGPYRVPASMFAAQAFYHGTTHRWQVGEALERFGVELPDSGGWAWWESGAAAQEGVGQS